MRLERIDRPGQGCKHELHGGYCTGALIASSAARATSMSSE